MTVVEEEGIETTVEAEAGIGTLASVVDGEETGEETEMDDKRAS